MPLARLHAPFDHPDWIFEPKLDGFRALAYVEHGAARLVSRNGNTFKSFPALTAAVAATLPGRDAVLDGEIVHLGPDGVPLFYALMRRRAPQHYYAFDLLWLDGRDLRGLPLVERKAMLRMLVPPQPSPLLFVDHVPGTGTTLFQAVCERDMDVDFRFIFAFYGFLPSSCRVSFTDGAGVTYSVCIAAESLYEAAACAIAPAPAKPAVAPDIRIIRRKDSQTPCAVLADPAPAVAAASP